MYRGSGLAFSSSTKNGSSVRSHTRMARSCPPLTTNSPRADTASRVLQSFPCQLNLIVCAQCTGVAVHTCRILHPDLTIDPNRPLFSWHVSTLEWYQVRCYVQHFELTFWKRL